MMRMLGLMGSDVCAWLARASSDSARTAAQVSELATEMKSYAKTLTGSVYTIDRRQDVPVGQTVRSPAARSDVSLSQGDES